MKNSELEALAEKVLRKIRIKPDQIFLPDQFARGIKVSADDIILAVGLLQSWGYTIRVNRNGSFSFVAAPDKLLASEISNGLATKLMARKIYAYKSVQSTNAIANQLALSGEPEGTLVIAEHQTRGRGRRGRKWYSPEELGIYCSVILKPQIHPTLAPGISLITAVALADSILLYGDLDVRIKWPNDVLISGKKVAGILTELSAEIDRIKYVITGVGVNINHRRRDFPENLKTTAYSLRLALNKIISRTEFVQNFLRNFEKEYEKFKKYGLSKSRKPILKYSSLINTGIRLRIGRKTISGNVIDIDESGRLVVESEGITRVFNAGEVTTY
jgi:BirA family biotin operon repressor/biotin-[acetyl-CoA-carboxylase] ligase